ncbi:hypothetical protein MSAN_01595100 [Mycena sanguinolenta]|uniref:Apple domain-containing protein n=1 Tax=Mycena sanguinolenta TaxID=230812 RepID=A0A8H7CVB7_9AGAR|nr:hypothetical protein MSAN_01595100 [Mycena sanguinolenta]
MHRLFSLATLLPFFVVVNATPGHDNIKRAADAGPIFAIYPGWDMNNGYSAFIANSTESACLQACVATPTCVAYTYAPYSTTTTVNISPGCYLKSTIDLTKFRVAPGVPSNAGLAGACGTFTPVGPTICDTVTAH